MAEDQHTQETEHVEPVKIPGLPPMNRHTYFAPDGTELSTVRYSYRRGVQKRRWGTILLALVILVLLWALIAAVSF